MRLRSLINLVGYITFFSTLLRCTPPEVSGPQKTDYPRSDDPVFMQISQLEIDSSLVDVYLVDKLDMELDQDILDQLTSADLSELLDQTIRGDQNLDSDLNPDSGQGSELEPSTSLAFECESSPIVIDSRLICDGNIDCPDQSDEDQLLCRPGNIFVCMDGSKVSTFDLCDAYLDCPDGSDEMDISICPEGIEYFQCINTTGLLPQDEVCDGFPDCEDDSDESVDLCGSWECDNGEQIPPYFVCDDFEDCEDGSDEQNCSN